jgi:peroxiredoxin
MNRRSIAIITIILGFVLIAVALTVFSNGVEGSILSGSREDNEASGNVEIKTSPEVGAYAPDFTLESVSGEEIQLSDYQGQVILVNFWAVWCPPCRQEMPAIQTAANEYGEELVVLMINAGDAKDDAIAFLDAYGFSFQALLDAGYKVNDQYRVRGLPTTFFIDGDGIIQIMHVGLMEEAQLADYLAEMGVAN